MERLTGETMAKVFHETLPRVASQSRSTMRANGASGNGEFTARAAVGSFAPWVGFYRLPNADVVEMLQEVATDFRPPQRGGYNANGIADKSADDGGTGLYGGSRICLRS